MSKTLFSNNGVFLCGHRKSGTTLLLNLLDSHPNLSVYPADSGFFFKYYPLCEIENYDNDKKINEMIKTVIGTLEIEFSKLDSSKFDSIGFDMEKFKENFKEIASKTDLSPKNMLISLQIAFQNILTKLNTHTMWVEKPLQLKFMHLMFLNGFQIPNSYMLLEIHEIIGGH